MSDIPNVKGEQEGGGPALAEDFLRVFETLVITHDLKAPVHIWECLKLCYSYCERRTQGPFSPSVCVAL